MAEKNKLAVDKIFRKKKGITFEERVKRSMGTDYGKKKAKEIIKKDKAKGNDPTRIVAYPPARGPDKPKQGATTVPPKIKKEQKSIKTKEPKKLTLGAKTAGSTLTEVQRQTLAGKQNLKKEKETKKDPLAGKPRSIAAARKAGQKYFFDKNGVKKLAVTGEELKKKGMTLKEWANKFAPKKVSKKEAEKFKKKASGGMMKKKGYAAGGRTSMTKQMKKAGGMMKKKSYAGGGKLKMVEKDGKKVPFYAADGKGKMRGGGMMKKKMYAGGGKMKKKTYAKGGKVLKMRGGGLATKGTNFRIR